MSPDFAADTSELRVDSDAIISLLGTDPVPWILESEEPFARWVALSALLGRPRDDVDVAASHAATLADPRVRSLLADLPTWGESDFPGHHSPLFLPNRLNLLADMGFGGGDEPVIELLLDAMLEHQDKNGHFCALGQAPGRPKPEWGSLLCDTHAIVDVLLRFGRGSDERVAYALNAMALDETRTPQGVAWPCVPDARTLFRGPGRKADVCPQVTLEALRAFSQVPERASQLLDTARTPLEVWRRRTEERPYQFGHGYQFKSVKWPNFWYDVLWVLETVGRYPGLWRGETARAEDRRSIAELAACLIAYNFDENGRVVPRRVYRGFDAFSFGEKRDPSPFATARALVALARVADLAEEIRAVEVESLPSSIGGSGVVKPPARRLIPRPEPPAECPVPRRSRQLPWETSLPRVLSRHHLQARWEHSTVESVVSDVVAVHAAHPFAPYASFEARMPGLDPDALDRALYDRRSLVTYRCMRGLVFLVRTDFLPVVHVASNQAVVRAARKHANWRGVDAAAYDALAPRILELASERPVSTDEIREALSPEVDVAATVTLMLAEGLLLRDRPIESRYDRTRRFVPLATALPGTRLDSLKEAAAQQALVRGYVRAFGPVLPRDITWWTGIGPRRVKESIAALGDELVEVQLREAPSEDPYLMHAADLDELETVRVDPAEAALLPSMDTFSAGYANRGRFVPDEQLRFVFDRAGTPTSVVLAGGRVAGVWDIAQAPSPAVLVHLFAGATSAEKTAVEARAAAVGRLRFGADVPVSWIPSMIPLADRPHGWAVKPLR